MGTGLHAEQRVLYKDGNSGWLVGTICRGKAEVNERGVWLPIIPIEFATMEPDEVPYIHHAEINNIFSDATKVEDWMKDYPEYFMTKEAYADFVESEEFNKSLEISYVCDGDYYYYPISKYTRSWIEKQPFKYVIRRD